MDTPLRQAIRTAFDSPTLANIEAVARAAPGAAAVSREELVQWAATLVRVVCGAELARDVDRDVAEPVRRIALQIRDAAKHEPAAVSPLALEELEALPRYYPQHAYPQGNHVVRMFTDPENPARGDYFKVEDVLTIIARLRAGRHE